MHYFIDGYNLIFRLLHPGEDLQSHREQIIQDLDRKLGLVKLDISIVFDAKFQVGERVRSHFNNLEILFTAEGETADEYILEEVKGSSNPRQETVITSDKKLAWLVRRRSAHTESVEDFMQWLNNNYKNKLRLQKKIKNGSTTASKLSKPPAIRTKPLIALSKASLEEWEEYYKQAFEARYQESLIEEQSLEKSKETNASAKVKKKPNKKTAKLPNESKNDMERWLQAFEQGGQKDDSDFNF